MSASYRDSGEVKWLVAWPGDARPGGAADLLAAACVAQLRRWDVRTLHADGSLPAPAVFGVPDVWPHVRGVYERAGFRHGGRVELVLLGEVAALPAPGAPPLDGLGVRRAVGDLATAFTAYLGDRPVGFVEVGADLTAGGTVSRLAGWTEVDNLAVEPDLRRRGVGSWLLGHAGDWLRLAGGRVVLAYTVEGEDDGQLPFLLARRFRVLTRVRRGYERGPADEDGAPGG